LREKLPNEWALFITRSWKRLENEEMELALFITVGWRIKEVK